MPGTHQVIEAPLLSESALSEQVPSGGLVSKGHGLPWPRERRWSDCQDASTVADAEDDQRSSCVRYDAFSVDSDGSTAPGARSDGRPFTDSEDELCAWRPVPLRRAAPDTDGMDELCNYRTFGLAPMAELPLAQQGDPLSQQGDSGQRVELQLHRFLEAEMTVPASTAEPQEPVTTVMVRNLPKGLMQLSLLEQLDRSGFAGMYDFCYMPRSFSSGENQGFAFVNFLQPGTVGTFFGMWHKQHRFPGQDAALDISPADVQGLAKNLAKWRMPRLRRIRNPEYLPFVRKGDSCAAAARVTEPPPIPSFPVRTSPAGLPLSPPAAPLRRRRQRP